MSVGKDTIDTMNRYRVDYTASYWVDADNEDDAIELAIQEHFEMPDGDWEAVEIVQS